MKALKCDNLFHIFNIRNDRRSCFAGMSRARAMFLNSDSEQIANVQEKKTPKRLKNIYENWRDAHYFSASRDKEKKR